MYISFLGNDLSFASIAGGEQPAGRRSNVALAHDRLAQLEPTYQLIASTGSAREGDGLRASTDESVVNHG